MGLFLHPQRSGAQVTSNTRQFASALLCIAAGVVLPCASSLPADEGLRAPARAPADEWLSFYSQQARSFELSFAGKEQEIKLESEPLLVYTNPVRGNSQHGAIFLWHVDGQPVCIGSVWSTIDRDDDSIRRIHHELHSLTGELLVCRRNGEEMWKSGEPGIERQLLLDGGTPAASRTLRLAQMRQIARGITAAMPDREGELRLMPQPVYRYPEESEGVLDGAVFSYVLGTDPELWLLVEARETGEGQPGWSVAFAQFTDARIEVRRGDRLIWECPRATPYKRAGRYYLMWKADSAPSGLSTEK